MNYESIGISLNDVTGLTLAFGLGLLSRMIGLPPLVGFLTAGFILSGLGIASEELIQKLADLGITLLLFTVGLKINLKTLARPQVWAVTGLHTTATVAVFTLLFTGLAAMGVTMFSDMDARSLAVIAFALSFSSTVFVVKALEDRGEVKSLHGRVAVGVLIMQDIAAVVFLALSAGKIPSIFAVLLFLLIPLRPLLHQVLSRLGHGELMVLFGFMLAMGGKELFELVGMKGDLGALVFGVLIASHARSDEMAKTMLGFKDLFLLGFFLSIGMSGRLSWDALIIALIITPFILLKSAAFFTLFTAFKLRARTSVLATANLSNYSEFGLIVAAIGVGNGWIENQWLVIIALAMSFSFVISAILDTHADSIYARFRHSFDHLQRPERLQDDHPLDTGDASVVIIGMGGIGSSAYDEMKEVYGDKVIGVDIDPTTSSNHKKLGRSVLQGDPSDPDFWYRVQRDHTLKLVMLALPKLTTTLQVIEQLERAGFSGKVAATSKFADEIELLKKNGVDIVFNVYTEAGAGFASHVVEQTLE